MSVLKCLIRILKKSVKEHRQEKLEKLTTNRHIKIDGKIIGSGSKKVKKEMYMLGKIFRLVLSRIILLLKFIVGVKVAAVTF